MNHSPTAFSDRFKFFLQQGFARLKDSALLARLLAPPDIAAGFNHSVATKQDRSVWAWGLNDSGKLGDGTTTSRNTPVRINGIDQVASVAAGDYHTLALKWDGTVWAWGSNDQGQCGGPSQIGIEVVHYKSPVLLSGLDQVIAIAAGCSHTLALRSDGTVWAVGSNSHGQLGDGTTDNRESPVQVSGVGDVVAIAAGLSHSLALRSDGAVWAWGWNLNGQLGNSSIQTTPLPVQIDGLSRVTAISARAVCSMALKSDGTVTVWGNGQMAPWEVVSLNDVTAIAAGTDHMLALKSDCTVWAWGKNGDGQLGDGTTTSRPSPVQISGLADVIAVAAGQSHSLALKGEGTQRSLWAWGKNDCGQLGDGTTNKRLTPVRSSGPIW